MSKELEFIETITTTKELKPYLEQVKKELKRLEAIDNSNPSEALECLKEIKKDWKWCLNTPKIYQAFEIVEQALLKSQEQEKSDKEIAFDLIDTKNVDIKLLKWAYPSVEAYNVKVRTEKDYWWREELTKEEFDFLGRMVGAQ